MADNSVIWHGLAINYSVDEFDDPKIAIPKLFGVAITGYIHPELIEAGSTSKKVYLTNKGNIMINPNDTILIEL